jgi:glycosyltransferase involved in cell wall biosynthesis
MVPAYNTAPFIADCLKSILSQRGHYDYEIILVDDASTDGTEQVARSFTDPRLRYIRHEKNQGALATHNEAFALCQGRFIARIDSDDRYRPGFLEKVVPLLAEDHRVGLVYGDIAMIDAQGQITAERGNVERNGMPERGNELFALLMKNYIPAPTTMIRREALQPLMPIPAGFNFGDWYVTTRIAEKWDFCFVNDVLADYRIHTANMHRTMIRDKTGEITSFKALDALFASPIRQEEKRLWRRQVYGSNYLVYAEKYFGCQMNSDARRCYWQAIRCQPQFIFRPGVARRFAATIVGRGIYERGKRLVRGRIPVKHPA